MKMLYIMLLLFSLNCYSEEIIVGFEDDDVPVLNEELRKIDTNISDNTASITTNTTNITTNTADIATNVVDIAANTALIGTGGISGWINFNGSGTIAINDSFNVTSIADNGIGLYTITWATDFADANYAVVSTAYLVGAKNPIVAISAIAAGTVQIDINNFDGAAVDPTVISIIAIGDQ